MGPEVTNGFACKLLKTELGFASSALADDFRTFSVSGLAVLLRLPLLKLMVWTFDRLVSSN
jgi:hypothetical protein